MGFQIGKRWLREKNYVEDGLVDVATRMENEGDGHNDADERMGDIEKRMPQIATRIQEVLNMEICRCHQRYSNDR